MNSLDGHNAKSEILRLEEYTDEQVLLIGGLAVQQYKRGRSSRDIDLVCSIDQQHKFDKQAYPSSQYESLTRQNDLQPDIIYKNLETGVQIYLGTKITERKPYKFIQYDDYFEDSNPFKYDDKKCERIRVPAPHHLAFSKLISFIARREFSKGQQDLIDFCDLTNHREFSLSHLLAYVKRVRAERHITEFFEHTALSKNEKKNLHSTCIFRAQWLTSLAGFGIAHDAQERVALSGRPEELFAKFSHRVAETAHERGINSVQAVTHTGQVSIRTLAKVLDTTTASAEKVRVLLRTPDYEDYFRSTAITRTVEDIKDFGFNYQFYSTPPFVHGFLVEYGDGSYDQFYSFYLHEKNGRTQIGDTAYLESGEKTDSFYNIFDSWFEYHWGKANNNRHTIVFDFDDTLADTGFIQIEAWEEAILKLAPRRKDLLSDEVKQAMSSDGLLKELEKKFSILQTAQKIAESLFRNDIPGDTKDAVIREIQEDRLKIRTIRTKEAKLFPFVEDMIPKLAEDYYLAIVSATDEKIIRDYLRNNGLLGYFSFVYGKFAPYDNWSEHIAIKTQNLIKMSTIIGVPLSRLIYVGDSNGDFVASHQVGVSFIEARLEKGSVLKGYAR